LPLRWGATILFIFEGEGVGIGQIPDKNPVKFLQKKKPYLAKERKKFLSNWERNSYRVIVKWPFLHRYI